MSNKVESVEISKINRRTYFPNRLEQLLLQAILTDRAQVAATNSHERALSP